MLTTLRIRNLALVADLTLEFQPGYNVITGETGAGKSIMIGALNLLLGARADRSLIRAQCDSCTVEALFSPGPAPALRAQLEALGLDAGSGDPLAIRRTFTSAGANRQFVNDSPVTLQTLAQLGEHLVDMHGPHDHQSLLHPANQLLILDAFGGVEPLREAFAQLARKRAALLAEKMELAIDEKSFAQQLDLIEFQSIEIAQAKLSPGEEPQLEQEFARVQNAAQLVDLSRQALDIIAEHDFSLQTQLGTLGRLLHDLNRFDPSLGDALESHGRVIEDIRELQHRLSAYADQVESDPERLDALQTRLNLLQSLKRKYGPAIEDVIAHGATAAARLETLQGRDAALSRLDHQIGLIDAEIITAGAKLSKRRAGAIPKLAPQVRRQLEALGFRQSSFEICLTSASASPQPPPSGFDQAEFQFAPNPGEPLRPLRAIASSGELARVMLALKTVLAEQDQIPVLIFDEVDANVGGETAVAVGEKMRQIARNHQVLCITHLAPVAACASTHFLVSKELADGRTLTRIQLLNPQDRVTELARMLGSHDPAALNHAESMLRTLAREP